ncbi:hypothetical protein DVA86_03510 [Streptomyces armeniacus]|uniref:Endonuclease/exonuclease/phosphatase domain-containing protein n=1 Tax=Streptomyces armeniacus TaxID=83291 RepID=A0A345XJN5_9ACTN|nr:hypothetical protein [Streptomyces armeniacus]AXK31851.1 hypothetical protein DVA86_03510 [Streptomyces armeniacus]
MRQRTKVLLGAVAIPVASAVTFSTMSAHAAPEQAAAGEPAAEAAVTMKIGGHNVKRGAAEFKRFAHVIGWQEVNDPPDRDRLRKKLDRYDHYFPKAGPARAVPISWRKDTFKRLRAGSVLTHKGEAKVTPNRYVNWVLLEHRAKKQRFIVVNTHFISGAWSKHPERQARWLKHADKLRAVVKNQHDKHPKLPIFVVGDFNRPRAMKLPGKVEYIRVKGAKGVPIDQAYATRSVRNSQVERLKRYGSDHFAFRFTATF